MNRIIKLSSVHNINKGNGYNVFLIFQFTLNSQINNINGFQWNDQTFVWAYQHDNNKLIA